MSKYATLCSQCGGILKGYYQFSVCSDCYSKNCREAQKKLLAEEKEKEEQSHMYSERDTLFATYYFLLFLMYESEPGKIKETSLYYEKFLKKTNLIPWEEYDLTYSHS